MAGFAKAILIAILSVASILVLFNMAFFFPWYMEVIETTYEISQWVATDNYLSYENYSAIYNDLKGKPIFEERTGEKELKIEVVHENGKNAIEESGPHDVNTYYYPLDKEDEKPYVQMGNLVTISVTATYPFRMQILGKKINAADIPVTFSMTTVTTRHYKDLPYDPYDYGVDDGFTTTTPDTDDVKPDDYFRDGLDPGDLR